MFCGIAHNLLLRGGGVAAAALVGDPRLVPFACASLRGGATLNAAYLLGWLGEQEARAQAAAGRAGGFVGRLPATGREQVAAALAALLRRLSAVAARAEGAGATALGGFGPGLGGPEVVALLVMARRLEEAGAFAMEAFAQSDRGMLVTALASVASGGC